MSLRRKMTLQIGAMIVGLLLVSAAALWGLNGLHQDYGVAVASYHELREIYNDVGTGLGTASSLLNSQHPDRESVANHIDTAMGRLDLFLSQRDETRDDPDEIKAEQALRHSLENALAQLRTPPAEGQSEKDVAFADMQAVNDAVVQMRALAQQVRQTIEARSDAAI